MRVTNEQAKKDMRYPYEEYPRADLYVMAVS